MPGLDLPDLDEFDPETDDFVLEILTKERKYRHFDLPIPKESRQMKVDFSPAAPKHRFLPLLGFTDEKRRVVRDDKGVLNVKKRPQPRIKKKPRPIRYASHADAAYFEGYAGRIGRLYEEPLSEIGLSECVLAYRKGSRTNIHHAKSLFDEVRRRQDCQVIAIDVSRFFDTLDHSHLKLELCRLLGVDYLQDHDWNVFRNMTRYSWVEVSAIESVLGKKRSRMGRICSPKDFKSHVRGRTSGLVRTHDLNCGIPQGTPLSGLYANLYMSSFDSEVADFLSGLGGSYRRYSDDIAIILPADSEPEEIVDIMYEYLSGYGLSLSEGKTDISRFSGKDLICDAPIQYLGFIFDGQKTLIRPSSLEAYRKKMERHIHAKLVAAKMKGIPSHKVYQREMRAQYTHLGKRRNFLKYAYKSADILEAPEIRQQVKPHVRWFERCWERQIRKVGRVSNVVEIAWRRAPSM